MEIPWAIIISLVVVIAAFLIKELFLGALEEDEWFKYTIGGFFVLYVVAAIGVYIFSPPVDTDDISLESVIIPLSLTSEE